jgi:hypothetical protein
MSQQEINRLEIIIQVDDKRITRQQAGEFLNLSVRQVQRLLNRYRINGAQGLLSKNRGQPGNHRYADSLREHNLALIESHYADFGPTLACEKLQERHDLHLAVSTVRRWMIDAGLWQTL